MRITTKLTLIISCLLIVLFMTLAWASYRHDQALALQETVDKARTIARQIVEIREYLSSVVKVEQVEENADLTPQVVATHIALRLTQGSPYYVRQVSLRYRNPQNQPDAYERETLQQFRGSQLKERSQVVDGDQGKTLRYLLPMVADQSCLTCHGSFEQAPRFIQQRFPKGHHSYNYQAGELIGAVSVSVPLSALHQAILANMQRELLLGAVIVLLLVLVTGWLIHRTILLPVTKVAEGIETVVNSGNFSSPITATSNDEIGRLVTSFNELMAELERRTRQKRESDERYRNFIEIAQSPIVTFLPDGKVVISNQKAEKLFGLNKDELLGQSIFDFFSDATALREGINDYFHAGSSALIGTTSHQTVRDICGRLFEVEVVISVSQTEQEAMFTAILRTAKNAQ